MAATRRSSRLSSQKEASETAEQSKAAMPPPPLAPNIGRKRKPAEAEAAAPPEAPTTPTKRRMTARPPLTPTPSAVGVIAQPAFTTSKPRNERVSRLADPNTTNATLLSPESSRIIASREADKVSPSKPPRAGTATTETLLEEANKHLIRVDERMRPLIENNHCRAFSPEGLAETIDPFESLASGIISQQVSGAAAKSIKAKFVALFHGDSDTASETNAHKRFPHPSEVAPCTIERLRTAGLSQRKAEYIQGLASKFTSGELTAQMLHDLPYDELVQRLLAVRGLGRWSVEMFACFGLKRMDVFSLGDLGVQRGMAAFIGRDIAKLKAKGGGKFKYMSEQDMTELSDKFAPYRSLFMWYMWRVEETDINAWPNTLQEGDPNRVKT
ncbi:hhH-GPD superfamily base excision DNA repair protein [Sarocladium implicatum]|nr:hhH-GPD superfamily base excision DNA repair protein [Sarocladium implicatum]